jgi:hypothetical protein
MMIVALVCCGALGTGLAASGPQAAERCAAEFKAVEAARAAFQAATQATLALEDKVAIQEELVAAQVGVLTLAAAEEQKAKNEWQAAIDRYMACSSRPRNNACVAEKQAMDRATDNLNAKAAPRRTAEAELATSFGRLADLRKALDESRDKWAIALKALQKAQAAAAGCRRFA